MIMEVKELFELLKTLNLPVAYDHFDDSQSTLCQNVGHKVVPPFILFRNISKTTLKADDKVHCYENDYIVDLVTEVKNVVLEEQLEQLFDSNYLPWEMEETYIDSERIYQVRYFI